QAGLARWHAAVEHEWIGTRLPQTAPRRAGPSTEFQKCSARSGSRRARRFLGFQALAVDRNPLLVPLGFKVLNQHLERRLMVRVALQGPVQPIQAHALVGADEDRAYFTKDIGIA